MGYELLRKVTKENVSVDSDPGPNTGCTDQNSQLTEALPSGSYADIEDEPFLIPAQSTPNNRTSPAHSTNL